MSEVGAAERQLQRWLGSGPAGWMERILKEHSAPDHRRDISNYPLAIEIPPRFGDLDPLGHINNVAIARILEEGRVRLLMRMFGERYRENGVRVVTAKVITVYVAEAFYPAPLTVANGVSRIGRSSYEIAQATFQEGRLLNLCETVHVYAPDGGAAALPQHLVAALSQHQIRTPHATEQGQGEA